MGITNPRAADAGLYRCSSVVFVQLTRSFTLSELSKSRTALNRGWDNTPGKTCVENLKVLCEKVLQPVRDHFNLPVVISSGYRSANVNRAEGGAWNSQHLIGEAADFEIHGVHNADIWRWILANLQFDQLIAEHLSSKDPNAGWIHVSYSKNNRKQALSCVKGNYPQGLHFEDV